MGFLEKLEGWSEVLNMSMISTYTEFCFVHVQRKSFVHAKCKSIATQNKAQSLVMLAYPTITLDLDISTQEIFLN